jgi:hypothetical protein
VNTGSSATDAVEAALVEALKGATAAGQWLVVSQLATELEARRRSREAAVVDIVQACAKREGGSR